MGEVLETYVGRLAPSPTGALHLGNVRTFMIAYLRARSCGGKVILRMEDLDHPRDKPGAAAAALDDLKWLGFDWDEYYVQSERKAIYRDALNFLREQDFSFPLVYPCVCSRKDVEAAQSAPHAGEQLHYPGTCRGRFATWSEALAYKTERLNQQSPTNNQQPTTNSLPCWRFAVAPGTIVSFDDGFAGHYEQDVSRVLGDFPLARDEGGAGYTLAATVDDLLMGVTEVVRGDDLLPATPAQILLARALAPWCPTNHQPPPPNHQPPTNNQPPTPTPQPPTNNHQPTTKPRYFHVPLLIGPDGKRLAKRHGDTRIATYRAAGRSPEEILGFLAASCGWGTPGEKIPLKDLIVRFNPATIPHRPLVVRL